MPVQVKSRKYPGTSYNPESQIDTKEILISTFRNSVLIEFELVLWGQALRFILVFLLGLACAPFGSSVSAQTQAQKAIVAELEQYYSNDTDRMKLIAANADYALLAWAAYEDATALALAKGRGWTRLQNFELQNSPLTGAATATVFVSEKGTYVLAFRGSSTAGDWVTNIKGTLALYEASDYYSQITDAVEIAEDAASKYKDLIIVGHSLGGRLAQVSALETNAKAVVFDRAPFGAVELRKWPSLATATPQKIQRFRGWADPLTGVNPFAVDDTKVSNIVRSENGKDYVYGHDMGLLALAMDEVRIAWDSGWLDEGNLPSVLPAAEYQAQYKETLRSPWNLPPKSLVLPSEKCTKKDAKALGVTLPGPTACLRIVTARDGRTYVVAKHHLREAEEGNLSIWSTGSSPELIGYVQGRHGIVPIEREGAVEFLGVDYMGWNNDAQNPPYTQYQISGQELKLVKAKPVPINSSTSLASSGNGGSTARAQGVVRGETPEEISCNAADWEGVIENVGDLFECDSFRAMQSLADFREVNAFVGSPTFVNGKLSFSWSHSPSYISEYRRRMDSKDSGWDNWFNFTQNFKTYTMRCAVDPSLSSKLKEGANVIVKAKLINFQNDNVSLECS